MKTRAQRGWLRRGKWRAFQAEPLPEPTDNPCRLKDLDVLLREVGVDLDEGRGPGS